MRGILDEGYRRGGGALRCVGEGSNQRPTVFPTFGAKVLAGLGDLPDTLADRTLPIRLRRADRTRRSRAAGCAISAPTANR